MENKRNKKLKKTGRKDEIKKGENKRIIFDMVQMECDLRIRKKKHVFVPSVVGRAS